MLSNNNNTTTTTTTSSSNLLWMMLAPLYISFRIYMANRMPIMDCDEVYNYWEPLHYMLYGSGMQTWEYAHVYALRTYAYLLPLYVVSKTLFLPLLHFIPTSWILSTLIVQPLTSTMTNGSDLLLSSNNNNMNEKWVLFLLLRATLAAFMGLAELGFCKALMDHYKGQEDGHVVGILTGVLLLSSTGMAHAAGALLPSSTVMGFWLLACRAYLQHCHKTFCLLAITATLAIGWPFCVLLFVPMGIHILHREYNNNTNNKSSLVMFFLQIICMTILVQGLVMVVDYHSYGKWTVATWNIFQYNARGGGDELYGVEPITYYVKNIFLNFNYVALFGMVGYPLYIIGYYLRQLWATPEEQVKQIRYDITYTVPTMVLMSSMYLWLAIVLPRPHKEERFLFPIYPAICLGAAMVSHAIVETILPYNIMMMIVSSKNSNRRQSQTTTRILLYALIWIPAMMLSASRTMALSKYYSAPLDVYAQLATRVHVAVEATTTTKPKYICTCGEWYRFPSSFFLPQGYHLGFLPTPSFQGQLPQPFEYPNGSGPQTTLIFNDQNQPQPGSYVDSIMDCDYLIDLGGEAGDHDCRTPSPQHQNNNDNAVEWHPIAQAPFLDAAQTSALHRILYLPYLHEKQQQNGGAVTYVDYVLYQRTTKP